jgi:hypothetical protein
VRLAVLEVADPRGRDTLDAYDLTRSFRDAGELARCSHHTIAHYVAKRQLERETPQRSPRRRSAGSRDPSVA